MPRLRRRHFLQMAGSSLVAIGLSQIDFLRRGDRLHQALAQPSTGKLALLIGINHYPDSITNLYGCANDVRLQYELLVHRYGFNPQDILIVTDARSAPSLDLAAREIIPSATRQTIIDAFQDHLIDQAKPEDVVIFHYSGHGSFVEDPHPIDYSTSPDFLNLSSYEAFEGLDGTLVPTDALASDGDKIVNDIMGSTLFLLSKALKTDNVTMVLDSCHSGGGVRGNLTYRAVDRQLGGGHAPSAAELAFQETLMAQLDLTREQVQAQRQAGIATGVAMGSARAYQLAAEKPYEGFQAGIFTYLLTRYLWQTGTAQPLETMFVDLARITQATGEGRAQDPIYFIQPGKALDQRPPYLLSPSTQAADAVVRQVRADQSIELWLGGMTPNSLSAKDSVYTVLDGQGQAIARLQQDGGIYEGLKATGHCINEAGNRIAPPAAVQSGSLLQEEIRGFGTDFKLRVGLHDSLGTDLEAAGQALAGYDFVVPVSVNGETATDVLLGRFDESVQAEARVLGIAERSDILDLESRGIGLLGNDLHPLTDTFGSSQYESIGGAISRLFPRLRLLLAKQALESIVNNTHTNLNLDLEIGTVERGGVGVVSSGANRRTTALEIPSLIAGEQLSLTVTNRNDESLYVAVIATEADGDLYVYHPSNWNAAELEAELGAGESLQIPKSTDPFNLPLSGPSGYFNVLVLASREQLRDSLRSLQRIASRSRDAFIVFDETREASRSTEDSLFNVFGNLFNDFSRAGAAPAALDGSMDNNSVVAFAATIEVVE
ncbi:MAG: DUF4384 domain-containing protein [Leptolyngbya sp. SIO1D8]|nr:DUF4384 domain-containing protein [Leptolyngbya sp. SIO1D8]